MENKSSNGWKFFALLFGALLAALGCLYIYKQQNPDYDPWEEPWENSSSPVDLGLSKKADATGKSSDKSTDKSEEVGSGDEAQEADES